MVDGHEMVISLIAIAFIAKAVSSQTSPELYQHLALGWQKPPAPTLLTAPKNPEPWDAKP
jgi:hypothetical protein